MSIRLRVEPRIFHFIRPATTSRGAYTERRVWYVYASDPSLPGREGVGECAPLPGLSCDDLPDYGSRLEGMCRLAEQRGEIPYEALRPYPSMLFGLETALGGLWHPAVPATPFERGEEGIPINGLVWMGTYEEMMQRMEEKVEAGFGCIKLKIGAIDFDREMALVRALRRRFSPETLQIRLDANGGFSPAVAMDRLRQLATCAIHSIEQPIRAGQWAEMRRLTRQSPIPIALDEELIGLNATEEKERMLRTVRPAYVVLKPSLHGGIRGTEEWVSLAAGLGIGSWVTSALETNVGLYAVAVLAARLYGPRITFAQGLGTGLLFSDNVPSTLMLRGTSLWNNPR